MFHEKFCIGDLALLKQPRFTHKIKPFKYSLTFLNVGNCHYHAAYIHQVIKPITHTVHINIFSRWEPAISFSHVCDNTCHQKIYTLYIRIHNLWPVVILKQKNVTKVPSSIGPRNSATIDTNITNTFRDEQQVSAINIYISYRHNNVDRFIQFMVSFVVHKVRIHISLWLVFNMPLFCLTAIYIVVDFSLA